MTSAPDRRLFLEQYGRIRAAEGRGSSSQAYYRTLPFVDDPQWKITFCPRSPVAF
jgi:hypothetical protein